MSEISKYFEKQILKLDSSQVNIWFTSDTHFEHAKIIEYCKRPFKNKDEMTEALIKNWNDLVGPDDIVFHLGDFSWGGSAAWNDVLNRLNGHIHLVLGNHDMKNIRQGYIDKFESVSFQKLIYIDNRGVYLNHYPFLCYGGSYRGKDAYWQLFGHVHTCKKNLEGLSDAEVKEILGKDEYRMKYLMPTQYDVGVDNNDYKPVSWQQVKDIIEKQVADEEARLKENEPKRFFERIKYYLIEKYGWKKS